MRYQIPPDHIAVDLLTEQEYDNLPNEKARVARGRARAWGLRRAHGPTGRLRELAQGTVGDSILFTEYRRSSQLGALIAAVGLDEGAQFRCSLERSLVDDSVIGVRVTLAGFTR
jgi:hypothetical protein